MSYRIKRLSPKLLYITLDAEPTPAADSTYVADLRKVLTEAEEPQYFLVDFRKHITTSIGTIGRLAELTKLKQFGASIAFSSDRIRQVYAGLFTQLSRLPGPCTVFDIAEQAVAELESLKPGIMAGVDWKSLLD